MRQCVIRWLGRAAVGLLFWNMFTAAPVQPARGVDLVKPLDRPQGAGGPLVRPSSESQVRIRVIGGVGVADHLEGRLAGSHLIGLVEQTIREVRSAAAPSIQHFVFSGNLLSFVDATPGSFLPNPADFLAALLGEKSSTSLFFQSPRGVPVQLLDRLGGALRRLSRLGVKIHWLVGARELDLNATLLQQVNGHAAVEWIDIPQQEDVMKLHNVLLGSGRSFDFCAAPMKGQPEIPFSAYIRRLLLERETRTGNALPAVGEWDICRRAIRDLILHQSSPQDSVAKLQQPEFVREFLHYAASLAANIGDPTQEFDPTDNTTRVSGNLTFVDGSWKRVIRTTKGFDNFGEFPAELEVSLDKILSHFSSLGSSWLHSRGESVLTNTLYATRDLNFETILRMADPTFDAVLLGHLNIARLDYLPSSSAVIGFLDSWRRPLVAAAQKPSDQPGIDAGTCGGNHNGSECLSTPSEEPGAMDGTRYYGGVLFVDVSCDYIEGASHSIDDLRPTAIQYFRWSAEPHSVSNDPSPLTSLFHWPLFGAKSNAERPDSAAGRQQPNNVTTTTSTRSSNHVTPFLSWNRYDSQWQRSLVVVSSAGVAGGAVVLLLVGVVCKGCFSHPRVRQMRHQNVDYATVPSEAEHALL